MLKVKQGGEMNLAEQKAASATQEEKKKKKRALEEDADISGGL